MDFSSHAQTITQFLSLIIVYALWRMIASTRNKKNGRIIAPKVPEPPGSLPIIGHLHLLNHPSPVPHILGAMADKYGPIYSLKMGQHNLVVITSPKLVKECLATNDKILATRPKIATGRYMGYNNAIFALAPYGPYWRDIRKIATLELFSSQSLQTMKNVLHYETNSFIKDLYSSCENNSSAEVTMSELFETLTFNITLKKIAGKRYTTCMYKEKGSVASKIKHGMESLVYLSGVFVVSDAIPWLEMFDIGGYLSKMKKTSKDVDSILENWLNEHVEKKKKKKDVSDEDSDFMDVLLSKIGEGESMAGHPRDIVVKATALILIMTGTESTAIALTWTLSLLLNNPSAIKAAQKELDFHVGKGRWVEESDLPKLKYLEAIIKETLRLYPPGPVTGPREAMEDCYIGGYYVPKGTRVIIDIWKLHRDQNVWSDPTEFKPERFMTNHTFNDVEGQQNFGYIPFSSGRRSCPGMNYGLLVVQFAMARLLQGFDVSTLGGMHVDMQQGLGLALPKLNPLEAVIKPRLPQDLYLTL